MARNAQIAGIRSFFAVLKWIQLEQRKDEGMNAGRVMANAVGIGDSYSRIWSLKTAATRKNTLFRTESAQ